MYFRFESHTAVFSLFLPTGAVSSALWGGGDEAGSRLRGGTKAWLLARYYQLSWKELWASLMYVRVMGLRCEWSSRWEEFDATCTPASLGLDSCQDSKLDWKFHKPQ